MYRSVLYFYVDSITPASSTKSVTTPSVSVGKMVAGFVIILASIGGGFLFLVVVILTILFGAALIYYCIHQKGLFSSA